MADMTTNTPDGVLTAADVAALWTVERRKRDPEAASYKAKTVRSYLKESQQSLVNGKKRRYADHPVPAPAGRFGVMPWWREEQRQELIMWWHDRPGQAHGTGGWPAGRPRSTRAAS